MEREHKISCSEIRDMNMVAYLEKLGFTAAKIRGKDHWYLSPFRNERTASFKINTSLNRWYDHGMGCGGSLVDFCLRYFNCTVSELLEKFNVDLSFHQPVQQPRTVIAESPKIVIDKTEDLHSPALFAYLRRRKITVELAAKYCVQAWYTLYEKHYFALGFPNDGGGYELRSSIAKLSSSPKTFTWLKHGSGSVYIFEGFFDFLSFLTIAGTDVFNGDFIILNSASFFEQAIVLCANYNCKYLFLDRDHTGQNCSHTALALKQNYTDCSDWYEDDDDLNAWLIKATYKDKQLFRERMSAMGLFDVSST